MARTCFAFTLSGMYLFQLPAPFFFSQLRFCQALKILSTTPATCLSFRPWQDPVNEVLDQGLFFVNCQYPYVTTRNNFPAEMMLYCPGIVAKFQVQVCNGLVALAVVCMTICHNFLDLRLLLLSLLFQLFLMVH